VFYEVYGPESRDTASFVVAVKLLFCLGLLGFWLIKGFTSPVLSFITTPPPPVLLINHSSNGMTRLVFLL
jgi:hypothetical protein